MVTLNVTVGNSLCCWSRKIANTGCPEPHKYSAYEIMSRTRRIPTANRKPNTSCQGDIDTLGQSYVEAQELLRTCCEAFARPKDAGWFLEKRLGESYEGITSRAAIWQSLAMPHLWFSGDCRRGN